MAKEATRSKYVFLKTILDPKDLVPELKHRYADWAMVWAKHQTDPDNVHFHAVIRFAQTESWSWLRSWFSEHGDDHSYSAAARGWQRCVRYLLHLDSPDKPPIPRENLAWDGDISDDEISMLLGRPRAYLLHDLKACPFRDTFRMVDWLVNERGHGPGEVTAMLNCVMAVNKFVGPLPQLNGGSSTDDVSSFEGIQGPDSSPWDETDLGCFEEGSSFAGLPPDVLD